ANRAPACRARRRRRRSWRGFRRPARRPGVPGHRRRPVRRLGHRLGVATRPRPAGHPAVPRVAVGPGLGPVGLRVVLG
ncbi:MAG: hypothetical protein AVDCRST_MAG10-1433, partial [uncultured Acidimicrobiales bacterium]